MGILTGPHRCRQACSLPPTPDQAGQPLVHASSHSEAEAAALQPCSLLRALSRRAGSWGKHLMKSECSQGPGTQRATTSKCSQGPGAQCATMSKCSQGTGAQHATKSKCCQGPVPDAERQQVSLGDSPWTRHTCLRELSSLPFPDFKRMTGACFSREKSTSPKTKKKKKKDLSLISP